MRLPAVSTGRGVSVMGRVVCSGLSFGSIKPSGKCLHRQSRVFCSKTSLQVVMIFASYSGRTMPNCENIPSAR